MSRLRVRLTPRGGRDAVAGFRDGILHLRVAAPPVDGAANKALLELVARSLDVPRTSVRLVAGATARIKTLEVDGLAESDIASRLAAPEPQP